MLDKPRLEDENIIACLKASYGLTVTDLEFLPLGYDSFAGVYRVQAHGQTYFLKVKSDTVDELSVLLPHYLKAQGIDQIVAPLPTITQTLWGKVDHFSLLLYPFIEGKNGWGVPLSDRQWIEFGSVLKALHSTHLPLDLLNRMPKETFVPHPKRMAVIKQYHAAVQNQTHDHPFGHQLAAFWRDHTHEIGVIIDRSEQLGRMLQDKALEFVVCHADIHTGNLLLGAHDELFIVDWDQPVLAPKERDLMFVTVGGFVTEERTETLFLRGYGETALDPLTMAYYQYERTMEDLAEFAAQVFLIDASNETKQDSMQWFMVQFGPGGPVEAAQTVYHRALRV
jgi:spectinomycin phosphotransferase